MFLIPQRCEWPFLDYRRGSERLDHFPSLYQELNCHSSLSPPVSSVLATTFHSWKLEAAFPVLPTQFTPLRSDFLAPNYLVSTHVLLILSATLLDSYHACGLPDSPSLTDLCLGSSSPDPSLVLKWAHFPDVETSYSITSRVEVTIWLFLPSTIFRGIQARELCFPVDL